MDNKAERNKRIEGLAKAGLIVDPTAAKARTLHDILKCGLAMTEESGEPAPVTDYDLRVVAIEGRVGFILDDGTSPVAFTVHNNRVLEYRGPDLQALMDSEEGDADESAAA